MFPINLFILCPGKEWESLPLNKRVSEKGEGTQGEIWPVDLCTMQDSHKHPLNIFGFFFASELIVAVGENKDSATEVL